MTVCCDDNHQNAPFRERHELKVTECDTLAFGDQYKAGKLGQVREQAGGCRNQLLRVWRRKLRCQALDFLALQRLDGQQAIDKKTITALRRNTASRGMRAGDE